MEERPRLQFLTASVALLGAIGSALVALGFVLGDPRWAPAWLLATALYGAVAYGLYTRRLWAPALAQGVALFGVASFGQAAIALWSLMPPIAVGIVLHALLGGLALGLDDGLSRRQRWSLRFAGAALGPATLFALAPEQTGATMLTVLSGAALVWLGTLGVARGRTWGLLAALAGAPLLAVGVAIAPSTSWFVAEHFLVAQPLFPLMLDVLGSAATLGALLAVAPFVGPIVRFLAGRAVG